MRTHHYGYACFNINETLRYLRELHTVKKVSEIVFDELQNAHVCLVEIAESDIAIELVSGEAVKTVLEKGINPYHVCYEVSDLSAAISEFKKKSAILVSSPKPAKLFQNRKVAFLQTELGLVELLESLEGTDKTSHMIMMGNFTLDPILPFVQQLCEKLHLSSIPSLSPYDQVFQQLLDSSSETNLNQQGVNIIFFKVDELKEDFLKILENSFASHLQFIVFLCPPSEDIWNNDDKLKKYHELEALMMLKISHLKNVICINFDEIRKHYVIEKYFDEVSYKIGHIPYTQSFYAVLALLTVRIISETSRKPYKVIVVDADNTLWRGVCGEDGPYGIVVNDARRMFQQKLLDCRANGFLLCLCSKNNEEDVFNVFKKNKDMLLQKEHFISWKINWERKSKNIAELAEELNLNADDFIFIDDNLVECEEVKRCFQNLLVMHLPDEQYMAEFCQNNWAFDHFKVKKMDGERQLLYQQHFHREKIRKKTKTIDQFIEELAIQITISPMARNEIERVSELTQRTNQFNCSAIIRSEKEVAELGKNKLNCLTVKVTDRLGDYGLVGAIIYELQKEFLYVDTFLLSCRVLGRGVEYKIINILVELAKKNKIKRINFFCVKTGRNNPALSFLEEISCQHQHVSEKESYYFLDVDKQSILKPKNNKKKIKKMTKGCANNQAREKDNEIIYKMANYFMSPLDVFKQESARKTAYKNLDIELENIEDTVAKIWQEILSNSSIEAESNYFSMGANSLDAIQAISKIYKLYNVELSLSDIFQFPTPKGTKSIIGMKILSQDRRESDYFISKKDSQELAPLSHSQYWLWFLDQVDNSSWYYNMPLYLILSGNLDFEALRVAFQNVIQRHESLRTVFLHGEKEPFQKTIEIDKFSLLIEDVSSLNDEEVFCRIQEEHRLPFNLEKDLLIRVRLLTRKTNQHILIIMIHHIVFDGWSYAILNQELSYFYANQRKRQNVSLPELKFQYSDFSKWQYEKFKKNDCNKERLYWAERLQNLSGLNLPTTFPRENLRQHDGKFFELIFDKEISIKLKEIAIKNECTIFVVFLTIYAIFLSKAANQSDIVIVSPVSGRDNPEIENIIGCFVELIIFRISIKENKTFQELLKEISLIVVEAFENRKLPFHKIVEDVLSGGRFSKDPIFQVMFSMQNIKQHPLELEGVSIKPYRKGYDAARLELILELEEVGETIEGGFYYNTHLYSESIIHLWVDEIHSLTKKVIEEPNALVVLEKKEMIIKSQNNFPLVVDLFEEKVLRFPNAIAVQYEKEKLTYKMLNQKSNQLACYLSSQGAVSGDKIAIALSPSLALMVAIMACFKLRLAYVPIEISAPKEYLQTILKEVVPFCVIVSPAAADKLQGTEFLLIDVTLFSETLKPFPIENIPRSREPNDLAYIIYTSGTSGKPKGVMISQQNLAHLLYQTAPLFSFTEEDTIPLFHSAAFDFSVWEMMIALCFGGRLLIISEHVRRSPPDFYKLLATEKITIINQTPSAFYQLILQEEVSEKLPLVDLRLVILGGESLVPAHLRPWLLNHSHCKIVNMYGITEVTIHATWIELSLHHTTSSSSVIGKSLPGYEIFIINQENKLATIDEVGELYVVGEGLSSGYFNQPFLTKEKFIFHPEKPGIRSYKSGDFAKYTADGNIQFIGRSHHQAKIRGYRVDLEGVASVLMQHPGVKHAVLKINEKQTLEAYLTPNLATAHPIAKFLKYQKICPFSKLPNGMLVAEVSENESEFSYNEIFARKSYLSHGISIRDGDCIVDAGANIGLFSLQVSRFRKDLKVFAFEPIKETFNVLKINMELYNLDVICINKGLYSENTAKDFFYYEKMSTLSGLLADSEQDYQTIKGSLLSRLDATIVDLPDIGNFLKDKLVSKKVKCELITLSSFIAENAIDSIDLLKIDVEKSELSVLLGIEEKDWKKIKQIVVEVHNINNQMSTIIDLLTMHGYHYSVEQEPLLTKTDLYLIYASRLPELKNISEKTEENIPYEWCNLDDLTESIKKHMREALPEYMIPGEYHYVSNFLLTPNGKIDIEKTASQAVTTHREKEEMAVKKVQHNDEDEVIIRAAWETVLEKTIIDYHQNFFDLGGNSLLIMQVYAKLNKEYPTQIKVIDLFQFPTIYKLANYLKTKKKYTVSSLGIENNNFSDEAVAVIAMDCRFPGANNLDEFWQNICQGRDTLTHYSNAELWKLGCEASKVSHPDFVKVSGVLKDVDLFDADFFQFTPHDANITDPQQRIFLELAWSVLEKAGYAPEKFPGKIGVYAGTGNSRYYDYVIKNINQSEKFYDHVFLELGNEKDYLASRVAYKLGLTGAALNISTACSTSLVALIKGAESLLIRENDMVLAGGISLLLPERVGYFHTNGGILSKDGICRPFDRCANGTVISSGAGVVLLKRLSDAIRDNDPVHAIIRSYGVNNDGHQKIGFTAPSMEGQMHCIQQALQKGRLRPSDISYIEAHGTGTAIGDSIEISALNKVFSEDGRLKKERWCGIGSVKANIGHADIASGIAGFIKVVLMLKEKMIPPLAHFVDENPLLEMHKTPFYINKELKPFAKDKQKYYAGVSSFGIGGTNAHVILESFSRQPTSSACDSPQLIILSAKTESSLIMMQKKLQNFLKACIKDGCCHQTFFADVAFTLQMGRTDFQCRRAYLCADIFDSIKKLSIKENILDEKIDERLCKLGIKWLAGEKVEWTTFYKDQKRKRISLPLYPFQRKVFSYKNLKSYQKQDFHLQEKDSVVILNSLANIFKQLLGIDLVDDNTHFFSSGADSFLALLLLSKIKETFSVSLTLNDIYENPILQQLASVVLVNKNKAISKQAMVILRNGDPKKSPIFIIHPPNGLLIHYANFLKHLVYDGMIYGIQNPLMENDKETFPSFAHLAKQYKEMIERISSHSCILLGWSFGGCLAFEIAYQLEQVGFPVTKVVLIDAWATFSKRFQKKSYHHDLIKHVKARYFFNEFDFSDWVELIWNRFKKLLQHTYGKVSADIVLIKPLELYDEYKDVDDPWNHWRPYTVGKIEVLAVPGNHESMMSLPEVKEVAHLLSNGLISEKLETY